jgi:ABC-type nitrate/sulfonate/bicarbonate transport system substrate-binding protein
MSDNDRRTRARGLTRRRFIGTVGAGAAATAAGRPQFARAQTPRKIRFTTSWVPQGDTVWAWVAKSRGFWKKRGLDVELAAGRGSLAATQAIAGGQFDFGSADTGVMILGASKGLPLKALGVITYKNMMGVGVPADSPIRKPRDLEGKKVGSTPASGEVAYFPVFAQLTGVDPKKIDWVNMDLNVRYRALMERQIDAMTDYASSAIPPLVTQGKPVRFMLYADAGMDKLLQLSVMTQQKIAKDEPALCQDVVDGAMEGVQFVYKNFDESLEIFLKEVPEVRMSQTGREFIRLGMLLFYLCGASDDAVKQGLGWVHPSRIEYTRDLVVNYLKAPSKPEVDTLFTNQYVGKIRLADAEWGAVRKRIEEVAKYFSA